jgi:lysylphosphatidylglycerol synthetase-like protein (DUF2156 family)
MTDSSASSGIVSNVWRSTGMQPAGIGLVLLVGGGLTVHLLHGRHPGAITLLGWVVAALTTVLVVGHGIAVGRPFTLPHMCLAVAVAALAVFAALRRDEVSAALALIAAGLVMVWPTGSRAQPGALPAVWSLVDATHGDALAPFAMGQQKSYVFSRDGACALAYRVRAGFAVVSGDPIGQPSDYQAVIDSFTRVCRSRGWRIVVLGASPRSLDIWQQHHRGAPKLWAVQIGRDVVVDVTTFSLSGRRKRNLRQAVQRTHNAGLTTTVTAEADLDPGTRAELLDVARVSGKAIDAERGFSMMLGATLQNRYPGTWLIIARDEAGHVQGFQRYGTAGHGSDFSLDLPWRRPDAPNGTDERLIVDMIEWSKSQGAQRVSLAFAPFPDLFDDPHPRRLRRWARISLHLTNRLIKLESLYRYLGKFDAMAQPRYILLARSDLPAALPVLLSLEFSPHPLATRPHVWHSTAGLPATGPLPGLGERPTPPTETIHHSDDLLEEKP